MRLVIGPAPKCPTCGAGPKWASGRKVCCENNHVWDNFVDGRTQSRARSPEVSQFEEQALVSCPEQYIPHQPTEALAGANETRLAAAGLRQRVVSGELTLAEAIDHPDAACLTITRLLEAQPGWAKVRARDCLAGLAAAREPIGPLRRVRDLSARQRALVVQHANPLSEVERRKLAVLRALAFAGALSGAEVSDVAGWRHVGASLAVLVRDGLVEISHWQPGRHRELVRAWAITASGRTALHDFEVRSAA